MTIESNHEPNLFYENETKTGFELFTISTGSDRHYRIIKENRLGFFYYDFTIDMTGIVHGDPVTIQIPFIDSLFVDSRMLNFPINIINPNIEGERIKEGIYKLIYLSRIDEEKEIPAKIDLNMNYYVGTSKIIRFIYYRLIDNVIYYTGYFGNRYFDNEPNPGITIDTSQRYKIVTVSDNFNTIDFYFYKINSTPNIIISNFIFQQMESNVVYEKNGYEYTLRVPGDGLMGIAFKTFLSVKRLSDNTYIKNLHNFGFVSEKDITVVSFFLPGENSNEYEFHLIPSQETPSLTFKIYKQ